jgi:hypothetical protein
MCPTNSEKIQKIKRIKNGSIRQQMIIKICESFRICKTEETED